ncbi:papain family cysteine protease [Ancylostoma duodenale]|uniref:Papain family cysteine protease n=1 Tax=Ancylostoma duodenale TaxID=51022 RepID=A0A0C2H1V7_9BILA|nr:papain family cysteine protease [Ancylostoma duodenale]
MSDRVCIASKGARQVLLSADDLLSCCASCRIGCQGGWPIKAWRYFVENGICSGGAYGEKDACKPYEFAPCGHHKNETYYHECKGHTKPPKCQHECQDGYPVSYEDDKHVAGAEVGGHVVKIIGWGSENDVPYWIMANSWNTDWGENGGFLFVFNTINRTE